MIEKLFDQVAEIYKLTETRDRLRDTRSIYTLNSTEKCAIVPFQESIQNGGAGEEIGAVMQCYMRATANIVERDVIKVISGSENGTKWIVQSVTRPRNHHSEISLSRDDKANV